MKISRNKFFGAFGIIILAIIIYFICNAKRKKPTEFAEWHIEGISEIRAYRINWDTKEASARNVIGSRMDKLNPSRMPEHGIKLNSAQSITLKNAVMLEHEEEPAAACFHPHHAFLFFDSSGNVVDSIDLCFLCNTRKAGPQGFAVNWDLDAIEKIFRDLKIPIVNPEW